MTKYRFWKELDRLVAAFHTSDLFRTEKLIEFSVLLKHAYDDDLSVVIKCELDPLRPGMAHHLFVPTEMGRLYMFYTSMKAARNSNSSEEYCEASAKDIMNNIFNREEKAAIAFDNGNDSVVIPMECLRMVFSGDMPKPDEFVSSRPGGWKPFE